MGKMTLMKKPPFSKRRPFSLPKAQMFIPSQGERTWGQGSSHP